jgi:hypothetical protein
LQRQAKQLSKNVHHIHCLKHTRGTLLAERHAHPYRIKLILGHKSPSGTEHYLHGSQKIAWAGVSASQYGDVLATCSGPNSFSEVFLRSVDRPLSPRCGLTSGNEK